MEEKITSITLAELKARPISKHVAEMIEHIGDKMCWNMQVNQRRLRGEIGKRRWVGEHFTTKEGSNDPRSINGMLDEARLYIHYNVFTDDEWEKYLIPVINAEITRQNNFVRWVPGYVIRSKDGGTLAIVEGDYAYLHSGRDFTSISVCELDDEGNIKSSWAWAHYDCWELVDTEHVKENILKMMEYKEKIYE